MSDKIQKKPLTIENTSLKDSLPYDDEGRRVYTLYEEAEVYRPAVRGYTEARLKLVFAGSNPERDPTVRFWFKSMTSIQALYYIMHNALNRRGTTVVDLLTTVSGNEKTKRQLLKDAEAQELIVLEKIDGKSKVIWPTVKMLNIYEQVFIDHMEAIQEMMSVELKVGNLLESYYTYKNNVRESRRR